LLEYPAVKAAEDDFRQLAADIEAMVADLAEGLDLEFRPIVPD
jgi:hypothetical protein